MSHSLPLEYAELLAGVNIFARLDRVALARLASYVELVTVADRADVVHQGDSADGLYIVARGTFGVFASLPADPWESRLGTLGRGDCFGEMGLLTDEPRAATVRAEGGGEVLRLERSRFLQLVRREPEVALAIAATLSRRLRAADQAIGQVDQVTRRSVEHALNRLEPERSRRVLEASLLDEPSTEALGAVFGEDAAAIARDLAELGIPIGQPAGPVLRILRDQFAREVGAEKLQAFAQTAATRLAEAKQWDKALAVHMQHTPRAAFLAALGRAHRDVPPFAGERAAPWVDRISDDEAAEDVELALSRASLHEDRGHLEAAASLLRRALGKALISGDSAGAARTTEKLARLAGRKGAPPVAGLSYGQRATEFRKRPRFSRSPLTLAAAVALTVLAAALASAGPQTVFVLLLGAAIVLWVSDLFVPAVIGLGLTAAWILSGIATPAQALAGFGSLDWVFVVAVLGIAAAVARSGLLLRVGLLLIRRMPQGLFWRAGTLMLTGLILSPLLPSGQGRAALTGPLALAIAEAQRLREHQPAAVVLGMAAWIGSGPLMFLFLNASPACLLAWGLLPEASRARFDWTHWFVAALPLGVLVTLGSLGMLFLLFRPGPSSPLPSERLELQLAVLGPPSRGELAMIAVLVLTVAGWIVGPALHVEVGVVAVLGLLGALLTGNFDHRSLQELDWDYLIFYGVALNIAHLAHALALDQVAADVLGAQLARMGIAPLLLVLVVAGLTLLARLVLLPEETVLLFSVALIPVALSVGVDPWVVIVTILAMATVWFLPSHTPDYLVAREASEGRLYSDSQARRVALGYAAVALGGLALSVPYWRLMGLL